jgi:hypothetical protein
VLGRPLRAASSRSGRGSALPDGRDVTTVMLGVLNATAVCRRGDEAQRLVPFEQHTDSLVAVTRNDASGPNAAVEIDPRTNSVASVQALTPALAARRLCVTAQRSCADVTLVKHDVYVGPRVAGKDIVHASWVL